MVNGGAASGLKFSFFVGLHRTLGLFPSDCLAFLVSVKYSEGRVASEVYKTVCLSLFKVLLSFTKSFLGMVKGVKEYLAPFVTLSIRHAKPFKVSRVL